MAWNCKRDNGEINVFLENNLVGKYVLIKKPYCVKCGTPEIDFTSCQRIHDLDWFDNVLTVGVYYQKCLRMGELLTDHILRFKSDPEYKEPLGKSMGIVARDIYPELLKADGLVPIPLHINEFNRRGFNQSLLLSEQLSNEINIPVLDLLEKTTAKSMQGLGFLERYREVEGLYRVKNPNTVAGKHLIIVDDVRASGATCSESAKMLKLAGAKSVKVFVLGTTKYSKGK